MLRKTLVCIALLSVVGIGHSEVAVTDAKGRITALRVAGDYMSIQTNLRIPLRGWGKQPSFTDAREVKITRAEGLTTWEGKIEVEPGKDYAFEQTLREVDGKVELSIQVTAEAEVDIEGVFLWLDVPIADFRGGTCTLSAGKAPVDQAVMPLDKPQSRHFARGTADEVAMVAADGTTSLQVSLDRELPVVVQDNREWNGTQYAAFTQLAPGLQAGETTSLTATLQASAVPDQTPASLSVDTDRVRYELDGFGGNYCFAIESPVTQYTLKNLNIAWARTEMTLEEWEPQNDNDSPDQTDWEVLRARDKDDSNLRREFELARQIQDMGVPYVISIWHLPGWLYADPDKPRSSRQTVPADRWDELLECIGSYLLHAKERYGVEPDLFCFNEANIGVCVYFSAEEHKEAIKSIGAYLAKLGLKTKMLLADATGPRGTHTYALPASEDPEAMQYVTAVGFHSWGGASAEEYAAWGDLAQRLGLPLLVTELGVDAGAWRTQAFDSFLYAVQEARMYQELLLYARPQGTMQWEFTADYSIVAVGKTPQGEATLEPTVRYSFVTHFCNLTPYHSQALATTSDNGRVLVTAFRGQGGERDRFTVHILNTGAAREATLTGLPDGIESLRAVVTGETEWFVDREPVAVRDGASSLSLEPFSLLTLTTVEGG